MNIYQKQVTWIAPLVGVVIIALCLRANQSLPLALTAGITTWTALWWMFEPVPIPVTSLIPIALMPLFGILTPAQVGAALGSPLVLLLLGGFMLSQGMQRSGVHRRLAIMLLKRCGSGPHALVFGFLLSAALLSMWISNTATALMLLPIALAALETVKDHKLQLAVLLAVAYGCSIGSLGTPIGTPPNLVFVEVYQSTSGKELNFVQFMKFGLPVVALMVPAAWWVLTRGISSGGNFSLPSPGRWRSGEKRTLIVFGITALLWITRREPYGGWSALPGLSTANDASVALLAVVAMFLIPSGEKPNERLLDWNSANKIPWGILLLFGSGICIAKAFASTGLSGMIGDALASAIQHWPLIVTLAFVCLAVTFLTELTSNTATVTLLMPILAAASVSANVDPMLLMLPAAFSGSCAFMLPVATGPNAVLFGSGRITIAEMARAGVRLNLLGAVIITLCVWLMVA